ncbi:serine/threonine-protein kinase [Dactylosporangium sp. NPDC049525]|uniref:serine/threonine-protein kinase n=1 Tax=Dactylosporangium sp. NPDC049525 TaxID=3154730 RepID=UPI003436FFA7
MVTAPRIRGYRDLTLISGSGGQAHVYRAHKATMDNSPVAIKVYKRELDDADGRRFLREVRALQALQGRSHVVRLLEADFTADGPGYVVMDLYTGSVADRLAAERTLPVADALRIGAQVAEALVHTHEAADRILHRDIKPSNILLTADGAAVLSDFGISAIHREDGRYTATAMMGTKGYMAPEVHAGRPDSVASDLYSLGATLHTLLLGEPPSALAPHAALHAVPKPVAAVLRRALAPDPADRQESARRLREELLRAAELVPQETGAFASTPPAATKVLPPETTAVAPGAAVRPRLLDLPVAEEDLGRNIAVSGLAGLGGLGVLTLLDWTWWSSALIVALPVGAAFVLRRALHLRRLAGPAAAATFVCYAAPFVAYVSRLGEQPWLNLVMALFTLVAAGGQAVATHEIERYVRHDLAQADAIRANHERRQLFEGVRDRYWLADTYPPDWLDDVLGPLPAARAMPWRDGPVRFAVVCDRSVVLLAVLDGVRPGTYELNPAHGHACRVYADGRPNTLVDTRLKELARRVEPEGWGTAGVGAGCVVVLTTDGTRSDGIRLAPTQFESTGLTVVVARDAGPTVVRQLAGADPLVIDPVLLRMVHERAARP